MFTLISLSVNKHDDDEKTGPGQGQGVKSRYGDDRQTARMDRDRSNTDQ